MRKLLPLFVALGAIALAVRADLIEAWDFAGNAGNEAAVNTTSTDPNFNAATISRGAGLSAAANADSYYASGWTPGLIDLTDYFEFSVNPGSSVISYSPTNIEFNIAVDAAFSGPSSWALRSDVDGYTANLDSWIGTAAFQPHTTTLSMGAMTTSVTFRLYGFVNTSGNNGGLETTGNDLTVNGTFTTIPEPMTAGLLGLGSLLLMLRRRQLAQ